MRGYQRKVIYVKNTGSRHFEEAYFVLRPEKEGNMPSKRSMVKEANRIIKENIKNDGGGFFVKKKWHILAFFLGCAVTLALCIAIGLLI